MTFRTIPLDAVLETVSRPIALGIARTITKRMNLNNSADNPQIYFNFNGTSVPMMGSTEYGNEKGLRLDNSTSIEITHEETPTQWASNTVKASSIDSQYLFQDKHLEVYVKPVYIPMEATLTVKLNGKTRESVLRAYRYLSMQLYNSVNGDTHETTYNYIMPNYVMQALINIADKRETVAGYGESVRKYLLDHFHPAITIITAEDKSRPAFTMREDGILVVGEYTHNADPPKPQKEDDISNWTISLDYKYYYDRPDYVQIQHPIQVHNQFLGQRFIEMAVTNAPRTTRATSGATVDGIGAWKDLAYGEPTQVNFQFRQPYFDDWHIRYHSNLHDPIISILCQLTPTDQLNLAGLTDVDDFKPQDYLVNYIKALGPRALLHGQGLVQVQAYRGSYVIDPSLLSIDEDLNVTSTVPLSLRDQFHVTVSLANDFHVLNEDYWAELVNHIEFFRVWISLYYPNIYHLFFDGTIAKQVPLYELRQIIAHITASGFNAKVANNFSILASSI